VYPVEVRGAVAARMEARAFVAALSRGSVALPGGEEPNSVEARIVHEAEQLAQAVYKGHGQEQVGCHGHELLTGSDLFREAISSVYPRASERLTPEAHVVPARVSC
jgi:hypothetical protein